MEKRILVADDEPVICALLRGELHRAGYTVSLAHNGSEAITKARQTPLSAAILDVSMPGTSGLEALREIRKFAPDLPTIMITAFGSVKNAVEAMKDGADDYVTKPFDGAEILEKLDHLMTLRAVATILPTPDPGRPVRLMGSGQAMAELKEKIRKVRDADATVLITGESGTGKNVVAQAIHYSGNRRSRPFVHVNCASLPQSLIESELFGYERGAYTGAVSTKKGKFELAEDGTIFLDEISTLSLELQPKLLSIVQDRYFERLGGTRQIPTRARIITATNEDLEEAIREHRFREDLYYRLNVIRLECPPLRVRGDDILELADLFLKRDIEECGKRITYIEDGVWKAIRNYSWPGNVRQLENTLKRMVLLADEPNILLRDLPKQIRECAGTVAKMPLLSLKDREFEAIISALENNNGHREHTAQELGISRRTLQYKLKELGLLDFMSEHRSPTPQPGACTREELLEMGDCARPRHGARPHVRMRAFGRFDVFVDGKLVDISNAKAKELLALCVDRGGGDVSMEEAIDKLWETREYDARAKNLYRKAVGYLRQLFEELGCPDVFASARGRCHVNRDAVDCDYFRYLDGENGEGAVFAGEYLFDYSWAEETVARLVLQNKTPKHTDL